MTESMGYTLAVVTLASQMLARGNRTMDDAVEQAEGLVDAILARRLLAESMLDDGGLMDAQRLG